MGGKSVSHQNISTTHSIGNLSLPQARLTTEGNKQSGSPSIQETISIHPSMPQYELKLIFFICLFGFGFGYARVVAYVLMVVGVVS